MRASGGIASTDRLDDDRADTVVPCVAGDRIETRARARMRAGKARKMSTMRHEDPLDPAPEEAGDEADEAADDEPDDDDADAR